MTWPHDLWPDGTVEPTCPTQCCMRVICPTWIQRGINKLWIDGTYTKREDCWRFARLARVHHKATGKSPPKTSDEFLKQLEQLSEREGIEG